LFNFAGEARIFGGEVSFSRACRGNNWVGIRVIVFRASRGEKIEGFTVFLHFLPAGRAENPEIKGLKMTLCGRSSRRGSPTGV
jgi:hypothetical protein